jgi:hypothetical protein
VVPADEVGDHGGADVLASSHHLGQEMARAQVIGRELLSGQMNQPDVAPGMGVAQRGGGAEQGRGRGRVVIGAVSGHPLASPGERILLAGRVDVVGHHDRWSGLGTLDDRDQVGLRDVAPREALADRRDREDPIALLEIVDHALEIVVGLERALVPEPGRAARQRIPGLQLAVGDLQILLVANGEVARPPGHLQGDLGRSRALARLRRPIDLGRPRDRTAIDGHDEGDRPIVEPRGLVTQ